MEISGVLGSLEPIAAAQAAQIDVRYSLRIGEHDVDPVDLLDQGMTISFADTRQCSACDASVKKLYSRSYCYDCFTELARCDLCFVSPERCHYERGTCREPDWGQTVCMQPHTVYLANSSGPKIGITRAGREVRRWTDQGAHEGLAIMSVPSRRLAGKVEAFYKGALSDRTDWRKLVTGATKHVDLRQLARQLRDQDERLRATLEEGTRELVSGRQRELDEVSGIAWHDSPQLTRLRYPVRAYSPANRLAVNEQQPQVRGNLQGVIGQFLLLSDGVFNMADHAALGVDIDVGPAISQADLDELDGRDQMSLF